MTMQPAQNDFVASMTIKETIDANIDDLKDKIEGQAKLVKTLLREALA